MTDSERTMPDPASSQRWLSIVGIGEDGVDGLSLAARDLISRAEIVFGGARHLALARPLIQGQSKPWPTPFSLAVGEVLGMRGRKICVLASGNPFFYGVGATLASRVPPEETWVIPAPSSFSLAAARMGWPIPDTVLTSVHGRATGRIRPHLHPGVHILALTSDGDGPAALAKLLTETGFGPSQLTVLEALGGDDERIRETRADAFDLSDVAPLNTVAIDVVAGPDARIIPYTPGLDDELFEHDGQLTKREVRAITLSSLAPKHGDLLWDVGAGSGSISIEWLLADPSLRAIAVEARAERAAGVMRNAENFGVEGLEVIEGTAPDALAGLEQPDAIFIGGGATVPGVLDACIAALKPGGRLVANAVTLETESQLIALHAARGGTLTRLPISRADRVGGKTGWRPAMPVTQWVWSKE